MESGWVGKELVLSSPVVVRRNGRAAIDCGLAPGRRLRILIEAPEHVLHALRPDVTAFLPMAVLIASIEGKDIACESAVDAAYLLNLNTSFSPLISRYFGGSCVKVQADAVQRRLAPPSAAKIGLMFSAGIDSFYSLAKMRQTDLVPDYLININAGAHERDRACWTMRLANIREVAHKLGVPLIVIDTNFHQVFGAAHITCHSIRNFCACFALKPAIGTFGYSSGTDFSWISFNDAIAQGNIALIDHVVSSSLTPREMEVLHLGYDATRIEKTQAIASDPMSQAHLDVCLNYPYQGRNDGSRPANCGRCTKCVRTIITLDSMGYLEKFQSRFELSKYRSDRALLTQRLLESQLPSDQEVAALIRKENSPGVQPGGVVDSLQ